MEANITFGLIGERNITVQRESNNWKYMYGNTCVRVSAVLIPVLQEAHLDGTTYGPF